MTSCARCATPTKDDLYLCQGCLIGLRIELTDVAGLIPDAQDNGTLLALPDDLEVTLAREDRLVLPEGHPASNGTIPLPYRPAAGEALWVLTNVIHVWVGTLGGPATGSPKDRAVWLLDHLDWVAKHPDAGHLADEVTDAIHQARRAIDRGSDDRQYLGHCGAPTRNNPGVPIPAGSTCEYELYGVDGDRVARCPSCGTEHVITARREWLRDRAEEYNGTAQEIAMFLRATGIKVTVDMVKGYARRGRLTPAGVSEVGRPVYRMRDVLTALATRAAPTPRKTEPVAAATPS